MFRVGRSPVEVLLKTRWFGAYLLIRAHRMMFDFGWKWDASESYYQKRRIWNIGHDRT